MPDFAAAYAETRRKLVDLVGSLDPAELATIVPACPSWTVKDLVAHLCHVAESYTTGNVPSATGPDPVASWSDPERFRARDDWTASGVEARKDRSLDEIVSEWDGHARVLEEMLAGRRSWPEGFPGTVAQYGAVGDISAHHNDIRGALGLEPDREGSSREISYEAQTFLLNVRGSTLDAPAVRFLTQRGEHVIGTGDPVATIEVDWFDFLRVIAGRRSAEQIRELFGELDAEPYLSVISSNPLPAKPLP